MTEEIKKTENVVTGDTTNVATSVPVETTPTSAVGVPTESVGNDRGRRGVAQRRDVPRHIRPGLL